MLLPDVVCYCRFVVLLSDDKDYFFILYAVYVGLNMLLAAFALLHWPGPDQLELVDNAEGYEVQFYCYVTTDVTFWIWV